MYALRIAVCAVAAIGCASSHEMPPLPVEAREPVEHAADDASLPQDEGAAGMSAEPALDPVCASLARLAARDGTIELQEDGSAVISVWLENTSDEDTFDYPGLNVSWMIENRYAGDSGRLSLYGLLAHDRYEYVTVAPAEMIARGGGSTLVVYAEPFTFASDDSPLGCEANSLEFSLPISWP